MTIGIVPRWYIITGFDHPSYAGLKGLRHAKGGRYAFMFFVLRNGNHYTMSVQVESSKKKVGVQSSIYSGAHTQVRRVPSFVVQGYLTFHKTLQESAPP